MELKPGAALDATELISHCKSLLGNVKCPKHVRVWADLPRSPIGKVLRKDVRAAFWKDTARSIWFIPPRTPVSLYSLKGVSPRLPAAFRCWIAPNATVIRNVQLLADMQPSSTAPRAATAWWSAWGPFP